MTLDLNKIFACEGASIPIKFEMDMSDTDYAGCFPLKKPVTVNGSVYNRASVVNLALEIEFEYSAPCDRCGEETSRRYTVTVEKMLDTAIEGEESDTILTVPDRKLDVDELVYTEVYVNLPTKHLCKESCKGICPQCGKNRNFEDCCCSDKEIDPRLAALAELLNN